jgi:Ca-activated chloride channel family protein
VTEQERAPVRMPAALRAARALMPWLLLLVLGAVGMVVVARLFEAARGPEPIVWRSPNAVVLLAAAAFIGVLAFHLHRRRAAAMAFSQTRLVRRIGAFAWLSDLPGVLRTLAAVAIVVALARPETYRTLRHEIDTIDIMLVVDMSKSMEETDLPRDRLDAAQRVIRRFLRRTTHDRIGLVVFGQQAMLQCPLTLDAKVLEQIVADLAIGDVPELGTAIGDGLALALSQLRDDRRDSDSAPAKSKVVILLSDGDSNWVTRFEPDEAARVAKDMGVKVYTVLVGREESDLFGGMSVNPATLRSIASLTGGEFFRATDYESFDRGFQTVRSKLDKTKRVEIERVPDKQMFVPLAILALVLLGLDLVLSHTRLRRLP